MTPADLARLHAAAFTLDRPWSESEFADLLIMPHTRLFTLPNGFALTRTLAGESELLTIAVDPACQRQGTGAALMRLWLDAAAQQADTAFLDVAADNIPALHLYAVHGFAETGRRRGYYRRNAGPAADAILMQRNLTLGQQPDSPRPAQQSG